jgi:hypothetical protein
VTDSAIPKLQTVGVTKVFERGDDELLVLEDINLSPARCCSTGV